MGWLDDVAKTVEAATKETIQDAEKIIDRWFGIGDD